MWNRFAWHDPDLPKRLIAHQVVLLPMVLATSALLNLQMIPQQPARATNAGRGTHFRLQTTAATVSGRSSGRALGSLPDGWRRTRHGWEDARYWPDSRRTRHMGRSMHQFLADQRAWERSTAGRLLTPLMRQSPLTVTLCQVILIGFIWHAGRRHRPMIASTQD